MVSDTFVSDVRTSWAQIWSDGGTQQQLADQLGLKLSTLRSRLLYRGLKLARGGKLDDVPASK